MADDPTRLAHALQQLANTEHRDSCPAMWGKLCDCYHGRLLQALTTQAPQEWTDEVRDAEHDYRATVEASAGNTLVVGLDCHTGADAPAHWSAARWVVQVEVDPDAIRDWLGAYRTLHEQEAHDGI